MKTGWKLLLAIFCVAVLAGMAWVLPGLPDVNALAEHLNLPSVRILDREGRLLYEWLPEESGRHTVVPVEEIPLALRQATIATEDSHFYQNPGVDLGGIVRSVWINLRGGDALAGGSTITQQVARNLLMTGEERSQRTLRRKLRETLLAWQLTRRYPKDVILGLYLNQMSYGGMTFGVEAAAQTYFGKPVQALDLAECALLAGLPQAPSHYNPFTDFEAARERQRVVLQRMWEEGYISAGQRQMAEDEPLVLSSQPYPMEAPHFVMMARARVEELLTPEQLRASGGVEVRTSLNLDWQHRAEDAIGQQIARLRDSRQEPLGYNLNNAALVALDPNSGDILALVGSPDYFDTAHAGAINMATSPRQPGSALKPLIYAAAFDPEQPDAWTAGTMMLDVSTNFVTHEGRAYTPVNYDGQEHGPVLAREALASSLNIPAVIALEHIGIQRLFAFASKLGVTTLGDPNHADLSIALGGGEVRLLDLTAAYGAFASRGYRVEPRLILEIRAQNGVLLHTASQAARVEVMDQRVAWLTSSILSDDDARSLGFGRNSILRLDRPAAVKTGTTTNFHDNWAVGYTPSLVVGVWAGNTSHEAMRNVTGLSGAAPIWHQFMRSVLAGTPEEDFTRPAGLVQVDICALSGKLRTAICPDPRQEWFIKGTEPVLADDFYRVVTLDRVTGRLADDSTPAGQRVDDLALNLPPRAQAWARGRGLRLLSDLAPAEQQAASLPVGLRMVSPGYGMIYHLAQNMPLSAQQIALEAVAEPGASSMTLYVDGMVVGSVSQPPFKLFWTLSPGSHEAWAEGLDAGGQPVTSQRVRFEVK